MQKTHITWTRPDGMTYTGDRPWPLTEHLAIMDTIAGIVVGPHSCSCTHSGSRPLSLQAAARLMRDYR